MFINDGSKFSFKPFERIVQIAPAYGITVCDFNGDTHPDIFLAQNFWGPQIENPRYDGGLGQLLLGDGKGAFHPVTPHESGIVISGDAKSASTIDLNRDGKPDLAVTVNDSATVAMENNADARWLRVDLPGAKAPGARVTLARKGGPAQTVEMHAGSGFLGQEPAAAWFGLGDSQSAGSVRVNWADGTATEVPFDGKAKRLTAIPTARSAKK